MGNDAELWIESGGDPTTLIQDDYWEDYYWEDEPDSIPISPKKQNTMVFIDAESVSADHCARIVGQCKKVGEIFEARYYSLQKDKSTAAWKEVANQYHIKPILMCGESAPNKIDNKIIKDIKNTLENNKSIDIFCIVSRDGDYAKIAEYIRSMKKHVVVLATKNTSRKLKNIAHEVKGI